MKARSLSIGIAATGMWAAAAGCSHSSRPVYSGPTGTATAVPVSEERGRVVSVRDVEIRDASPNASSTGGTLGRAVGIAMGSVTAIAGAVGDVVDASKKGLPGEELTILLDDGRTVMIVQERADPPFAPDERVIVRKGVVAASTSSGSTRVVRDDLLPGPRAKTERMRFGAAEPRFSQ